MAWVASIMGNMPSVSKTVSCPAGARQALEAHAGVDAPVFQGRAAAVELLVKLGKTRFRIRGSVLRIVLGVGVGVDVLALVVEELGQGPQAPVSRRVPEVVLFAETMDPLLGDADFLVPDIVGFVVIAVYGDVDGLGLKPRTGGEFPAPLDGLALEVVAEGEIAQHFEEGEVAEVFPTSSRSLALPPARRHFCGGGAPVGTGTSPV